MDDQMPNNRGAFKQIGALTAARTCSNLSTILFQSDGLCFDVMVKSLRSTEAGTANLLLESAARPGSSATELSAHELEIARLVKVNEGMQRLVAAVQELSLARDLPAIMAVVRRAARELTGADGATFVLREGDMCHYADEDAIGRLWKGQRFPLDCCISGWTMLNRQPAVIEDIYADSRIPSDVYRPTFVKSLVMVPIRTAAPIGAIGNYWAVRRLPAREEVELLQALANTTAVAMENVRLYQDLEQRVKDRTAQLEAANREMEAFSYAVSHDLGAPLRHIRGFSEALLESGAEKLDATGKDYLLRMNSGARRMESLISDLLRLSRLSRGELVAQKVDLSEMGREIATQLAAGTPGRLVEWQIDGSPQAEGDPGLLRVVLDNLLSNAWKYTAKRPLARIEFGAQRCADGKVAYFVRDNGAGFDPQKAGALFRPFQRLHRREEYPGSGIGLATAQRIIQRHGGRIWAEAAVDRGATFYFSLGTNDGSGPA